jgi:CBS domain-containing protein
MHSVGQGERWGTRQYYNPGCFHSAWQVGDEETLPTDEVGNHMTADPVMTSPGTRIADLARQMIDAHIHRIIVVDAQHRPIGVVSSTDILAAVTRADLHHP